MDTAVRRTCANASRALLVMAVFLGVASLAAAQPTEIIDRVLAVVAGDVIMLSDVRAAQDFALVDVSSTADAADPVRVVLSRLIDRALILDEVERYAPPEPTTEAVARAMVAVRARFSSSDAFIAALARAGLSEDRLQTLMRQNLRLQAYLAQRFVSDAPERTQIAIDDWVAGLRRRADILDLYAQQR